MKFKFLLSFMAAGALCASAEGYIDGVEYFRADNPEEAAMILEKTINDPSTDQATAYYYLGQIALQKGDKKGAKANFDKGIAANADNGYNYVGLGTLDLLAGNEKAAEDNFKKAKALAKKDADILTEIPRAYFNVDPVKYAPVIDKWLADIKKQSKTAPAPFILEGDRLAGTDIGESAGMYEMAASFDHESKTAKDAHPEAYVKYSRVIFKVNQKAAIDKLRELLGYQANSAMVQRELAEKLYDSNRLTQAAQQYEAYIKNPNSFQRDKQRMVGLYFFAERYPESLALANQILREDPSNVFMQRMVFYNKKKMGDQAAAAAAAEALLANPISSLTPKDFSEYAEMLEEQGNDSLALVMYESAVKADPTKAASYKDLSAAYNHALRFREAAEAQQKYMDLAGDEATVTDKLNHALRYNALASALQKEQDPAWQDASAKAVQIIEGVVALAPEHPIVLQQRARILQTANNGEMNDAVLAAYQAVLDVLDADPANLTDRKGVYTQVLGALGNYYVINKDMDNARRVFQRFYEIQPSEELAKYIETLN